MTTAAPSRPAAPSTIDAPPTKAQAIAVKDILVRAQARKDFDDRAIEELAASIEKVGLINPVTVRPADGGKYVLVAGERRLRAVKYNKTAEIAAFVRDLDDDEALEVQTAENLHRKNLGAIEEARGLRFLMDRKKYTIADLAKIVDKSESYVSRSVRLLELPKDVVDAIDAETLTPAHGHQLLRVPNGERGRVFKDWSDAYGANGNAKSLQEHIEQAMGCSLDRAAFPKGKPYAGQMACTACPNNSGNQGALFEGATKGTCLLKSCYDAKAKQAELDGIQELKKSYPAASDVVRTKSYIYAGSVIDGDWVIRQVFEKRIPKGKFILVVGAQNPDEVWLATPRDAAEVKAQERVVEKPVDKDAVERQQRIDARIDAVIAERLPKIASGKADAAIRGRWKAGWEAKWLKENGLADAHTVVAMLALYVHEQAFDRAEVVKLLGIDAKAEAKKAIAEEPKK